MMVTLTITLQAPDAESCPFDVGRMDAESVYLEFGDSAPNARDGWAGRTPLGGKNDDGVEGLEWRIDSTSVQVHPQAGHAFPAGGDNG